MRLRPFDVGHGWFLAAALALSLTKAWAAAPAGSYTTTADTVVDVTTGLTWQRAIVATTYAWGDARAYCEQLSLAGQTTWRLPRVKELRSIVDIRAIGPAIDQGAFPNTPSEYFWSSSSYAAGAGHAWFVHFDTGITDGAETGERYRVRCVR